jgi:hypothetical protein
MHIITQITSSIILVTTVRYVNCILPSSFIAIQIKNFLLRYGISLDLKSHDKLGFEPNC